MDTNDNQIQDYKVAGLDRYMRPLNAVNQGSFVGGMEFNTFFDRNAVTAVNLRNFSFNAGTGGTIVLGGTNNGNGNFVLRNSAGSTIVTGNNNGITVTNGSITINNSGGTSVLDSTGLVSTANFSNNNVTRGTLQAITGGTSFVDITSSSMSFNLARNTAMLFFVNANLNLIESGTNTCNGVMFVNIDGINSNERGIFCKSGNNSQKSFGLPYFTILSSGTHTVKLQARLESFAGTAAFNINEYWFSYILLGN